MLSIVNKQVVSNILAGTEVINASERARAHANGNGIPVYLHTES